MNEREQHLVDELHGKSCTHTEIAKLLSRERQIFKEKRAELGDCLIDVENYLLDKYKKGGT